MNDLQDAIAKKIFHSTNLTVESARRIANEIMAIDTGDLICYNGNHPSVDGVCPIDGGLKPNGELGLLEAIIILDGIKRQAKQEVIKEVIEKLEKSFVSRWTKTQVIGLLETFINNK